MFLFKQIVKQVKFKWSKRTLGKKKQTCYVMERHDRIRPECACFIKQAESENTEHYSDHFPKIYIAK